MHLLQLEKVGGLDYTRERKGLCNMEKKKRKVRSYGLVAAVVFGSMALILIAIFIYNRVDDPTDWLVYSESLDAVAVVVDEQELTLKDMAFYIAYDEMMVEEQAEIYDSEDTSRYWNVMTNGVFIRQLSKENVMKKAIHDEVFYQMAMSDHLELTKEDEDKIAEVQNAFWNNIMYEDKLKRIGVSEDDLNAAIRKIGIAQKYQGIYAQLYQTDMEAFDIGGEEYEKLLEDHTYHINKAVWDRVNYGDVTLEHNNSIFQ